MYFLFGNSYVSLDTVSKFPAGTFVMAANRTDSEIISELFKAGIIFLTLRS